MDEGVVREIFRLNDRGAAVFHGRNNWVQLIHDKGYCMNALTTFFERFGQVRIGVGRGDKFDEGAVRHGEDGDLPDVIVFQLLGQFQTQILVTLDCHFNIVDPNYYVVDAVDGHESTPLTLSYWLNSFSYA